ncbi:GTP cyclohydrolase I FolE [Candidatus Woesearchaeota archaeon]|nr:GTP cyclohydrolase I FolE [Candidatus Woesearchaeota archaeon]
MDKEKAERAIRELLIAIGEDPDSDGLKKTPKRVAELYEEIFSGKKADPGEILQINHRLEHDEMVVVKDIPFYSMCEHDLLPFFGKCHIAYVPDGNRIVGINRLSMIVDAMSKRLQIQEKLTTEIADTIMKHLSPKGVGVVIDARHLCMEMRGVKQPGTKIITSAVRGRFRKDMKTREEFLSLIKNVH